MKTVFRVVEPVVVRLRITEVEAVRVPESFTASPLEKSAKLEKVEEAEKD